MLERNIKQRIEAGEVLVGGWAQTQSPELVEAMGYAEFDFVILDTEHTAHSYEGVIHQLRAAEVVGLHPIVRPPSQDPSLVSRALDLGAEGVFVPVIENADQAESAVKAAKYHPLGRRGICVAVKPGKYGAAFSPRYFDQQNDRTWLVAMVETWEGRDHMTEIVQVPGVDLIFVGPTDLSQSLGVPGEVDHPKVERAIEEIASVAKAHDMPLGIHVYNVEDRKEMDRRIDQGFQLLTVMLDTALFFKACKQVREVANPKGPRD